VIGEQEAVVTAVRPFDLHGVRYYDLELKFPDGNVQTARLGSESVPDGLNAGDQVLVTMAANMAVSIRWP
jgi:hypothetical protein